MRRNRFAKGLLWDRYGNGESVRLAQCEKDLPDGFHRVEEGLGMEKRKRVLIRTRKPPRQPILTFRLNVRLIIHFRVVGQIRDPGVAGYLFPFVLHNEFLPALGVSLPFLSGVRSPALGTR